MKKSRLVLVGNGMAGVRALEELLKIAPELYDITVFGAEPHPNYNRILLSPVLAGEQTIDEIILNPLSWYADNGIRLWSMPDGTEIAMKDAIEAASPGFHYSGGTHFLDQTLRFIIGQAAEGPTRKIDVRVDNIAHSRFTRLAVRMGNNMRRRF